MKRNGIILAFLIGIILFGFPGIAISKEPGIDRSRNKFIAQRARKWKKGKEPKTFGTKWCYMDLPELTNKQRWELALKARSEGKRYFARTNKKARELSDRLEKYIRRWLKGEVPAELPRGLLPPYIDCPKTHSWKLVRPDQIRPEDQWYVMKAYDPGKELHQHSPDPHATYLKLIFIAPLGSKLLVEGDFPYCRFMDYQILTPLDPEHPVTGHMGICEAPIVDVDIEPDSGHINPFRLGANRNAKRRRYHLTFKLKAGNAVKLNPGAMKAPMYRGKGNTRAGGPFAFSGPWGGNVFVPSVLWLRYYAPDKNKGPMAGVPIPRVTLQLSTGEKFWLTCDKTLAVKRQTRKVPVQVVPPMEPYPFIGPSLGWSKMFGILLSIAEGRAYYTSKPWGPKSPEISKKAIRVSSRAIFNRGPDATPPGNYECSATCCNYISYLLRPMCLGKNKVIVLTGKLPTFPRTRKGEKKMTGGQVRYFSITHQYAAYSSDTAAIKGAELYSGIPFGSLMDDEIKVNNNNKYIIVYSRKEEKPSNAHAPGITWREWGPASRQGFVVRWLSVRPHWYLRKYAPHEDVIPWEKGAWSQVGYDESLVSKNSPGVMGPYHPVIHYMTREEFESLGSNIRPKDLPKWKEVPVKRIISELEQAKKLSSLFKNLRNARKSGDRKGMMAALRQIKKVWNSLSEDTRRKIEARHPGITRKIEEATKRIK